MSELKTFYVRDEKKNPLACVVYDVRQGVVEFAMSVCHKDDSMQKKFGRAIALERFLQGKTLELGFCDKTSSPKAHIMKHFVASSKRIMNMGPIYPKRVIKNAKRWLAQPVPKLEAV